MFPAEHLLLPEKKKMGGYIRRGTDGQRQHSKIHFLTNP